MVSNRRPSDAPNSAALIAVATWGRNNTPYCVLDKSYSCGPVKIVLAAGNVTSTIPCTVPAAYATLDSARVAISPTAPHGATSCATRSRGSQVEAWSCVRMVDNDHGHQRIMTPIANSASKPQKRVRKRGTLRERYNTVGSRARRVNQQRRVDRVGRWWLVARH